MIALGSHQGRVLNFCIRSTPLLDSTRGIAESALCAALFVPNTTPPPRTPFVCTARTQMCAHVKDPIPYIHLP